MGVVTRVLVLQVAGRLLLGGAQQRDAAVAAGIGLSTLQRYLTQQDVFVLHQRKLRPGCLSLSDREEIRVGVERGESDATIAGRIGCHRATVWREIARNGGRRSYRAVRSDNLAAQAARRPKTGWTLERPWLWAQVQALLHADNTWYPNEV